MMQDDVIFASKQSKAKLREYNPYQESKWQDKGEGTRSLILPAQGLKFHDLLSHQEAQLCALGTHRQGPEKHDIYLEC